MVIYLFINDELNFDGLHENSKNLYRLNEVQSFTGTNVQNVALSMPGMGPSLQADFPEIVRYTRFWGRGKQLYKQKDKELLVEKTVFVDSTFLSIFDFDIIAGEPESALTAPNSIVLSEKIALLFFDSPSESIDQSIEVNETLYKITGVIQNTPENSHLQFDALVSMRTILKDEPEFDDRWGSNFLVTYLELIPDADVKKMAEGFPDYLIRHTDEEEVNDYYKLYLQPLQEVHLGSMDVEHDYHNYRKFDGSYLKIFTIVGLFILLIASVNFMNLATARASYRWKEVGVRKSVGAGKTQLFGQFVLEAMLLGLFSFVFALLLAVVFVPWINSLIGRSLSIMNILLEPDILFLGLLVALVLGFLSGIYPSVYLSSFKPAAILKGLDMKGKKSVFRSTLVILQFGLAIAMIVSTLVVTQQLRFMKHSDIGFETDQIVLIDMNNTANEVFGSLKSELVKNSNILGVTAAGQRIGNNFHQWSFKIKTDTAVIDYTPSNVNVDFDYLDVYEISLNEGRTFDESIVTDDGYAFIINETFAKELNLTNPVGLEAGHNWYHNDSLGQIIGVANDFNFNSMHYKINTLAMVVHPDWGYDELSVKINAQNVQASLEHIQKTWIRLVPDWPFQYSFLDSHFEELYRSDQQMTSVVSIMAGLAILIACMGLFGLSSITTERKTKEIGIRKVLGASLLEITMQLSKNFALLIVVAFILFSPFTYLFLQSWLTGFAYKVGINPILFIEGSLIAFVIAMGTISYHTIRSANRNPVRALRYE